MATVLSLLAKNGVISFYGSRQADITFVPSSDAARAQRLEKLAAVPKDNRVQEVSSALTTLTVMGCLPICESLLAHKVAYSMWPDLRISSEAPAGCIMYFPLVPWVNCFAFFNFQCMLVFKAMNSVHWIEEEQSANSLSTRPTVKSFGTSWKGISLLLSFNLVFIAHEPHFHTWSLWTMIV